MIQAPRRGRLRFACSTECSGAFHSTARGYHVAFGLLDPANMTPVVLEEIGKANQLSDATAKTVVEGCVVM